MGVFPGLGSGTLLRFFYCLNLVQMYSKLIPKIFLIAFIFIQVSANWFGVASRLRLRIMSRETLTQSWRVEADAEHRLTVGACGLMTGKDIVGQGNPTWFQNLSLCI